MNLGSLIHPWTIRITSGISFSSPGRLGWFFLHRPTPSQVRQSGTNQIEIMFIIPVSIPALQRRRSARILGIVLGCAAGFAFHFFFFFFFSFFFLTM